MPRILTGIQSTGLPHLGNVLGAMIPALELAKQAKQESLFFIADLHTLTAQKDTTQRQAWTQATAAAWLALGLKDQPNVFLYRQSQIPMVCELAWYLNCFTPYPMLANAHAFKSKAEHLALVNAGLFTYPVLMAADILLYDAQVVPVGIDQQQHLEITRNLARSFNHQYGDILTLPKPHLPTTTHLVPGLDGRKMSKSYDNTLSPFTPPASWEKAIMRIPTDSTPIAEPKNPDTCTVFQLYSHLATAEEVAQLHAAYQAGGMGYGTAKKQLLEVFTKRFTPIQARFTQLMENPQQLEAILAADETHMRQRAQNKLDEIRQALGFPNK